MSFQEFAESRGFCCEMSNTKKAAIGVVAIACIALVMAISTLVASSQGEVFAVSKADSQNEAASLHMSQNESDNAVANNGSGSNGVDGADSSRYSSTGYTGETIKVHVTGCVISPGVYELPSGSRVADGISAAGGLAEDALEGGLNQARKLVDGEQIAVPSIYQGNGASGSDAGLIDGVAGSLGVIDGKVNINAASSEQLQTISGVGESTAQKIIDYRDTYGPFETVDDLVNVPGIGEKKLAAMRNSICVA